MRVSNSKIKTWRRCPNKYRYKYRMRLRPKRKALELERGSWIHELLMVHYDGEDWKARHKALTKKFYSMFEEEREMLGDLPTECKRIMEAYLRTYKNEDKQIRVVDSELNEIVTLPNGLQLQVIVDLIVEDRKGRLWAWDHKTRKNFGDTGSMLLDPQLTLYYYALELLGYKPMGGVLYNELRTKPPAVPQLLKAGGLSKRMNIDTDVYTYLAEIHRHGLDPNAYTKILQHLARNQKDRFFKRTVLPKDPPMLKQIVKELVWSSREIKRAEAKGEFPRTFIPQSCRWDCEFKELCIAELHGSDISSMIKSDFVVSRHGDS
jgi:hypothetical protein